MAVCHLPLETILSLPPAISRPRSPHPHSPCLPRSLPRTLAAHLGLRSAVGPATTTAAVQIDPSVAFECTSQSPGKGCCDERLNPPSQPDCRGEPGPQEQYARRSVGTRRRCVRS